MLLNWKATCKLLKESWFLTHYAVSPTRCSGNSICIIFPPWTAVYHHMGWTTTEYGRNIWCLLSQHLWPIWLVWECQNTPEIWKYYSTHSYTCSGWTLPEGQMYKFTVQTANCGGVLSGPKSGPVTVSLQGTYVETKWLPICMIMTESCKYGRH